LTALAGRPPARSRRHPAQGARAAVTAALLVCGVLASCAPIPRTARETAPLIVAHRGASGYLPEHTLESYRLAIELGADYIEPDLVSTRDGVLIARHEPMLGGTTNVAELPRFAGRRRTMVVDGVAFTDWFASDFTLAEIKQLRAIQPRADRPRQHDRLYEIPTLDEVVRLAKEAGVGIYPETKHPTFHDRLGLSLEEPLLAVLSSHGWNSAEAPVFIQSFEVGNLRELNARTNVRLIQLIGASDVHPDGTLQLMPPSDRPYDFTVAGDRRTFADLLTADGLRFVAEYADGIGPWKPYLLKTRIHDRNTDGVADDLNGDGVVDLRDREVVGDTGVIAAAHAAGLLVHGFTFRNDTGLYGFSTATLEYQAYYALGIDGVFTDFPDTARTAIADDRPGA
jgi:glycerophosphoryl diester phosphodiesterase